MRFNLLFVIENRSYGGGERGFSQLIRGIDPGRFRVLVASSSGGRFQDEIREAGVPAVPVSFGRMKMMGAVSSLMEVVRREKIDVIHSQGAWADFLARTAGRLIRIPALVSTVQMPVEGFDVPPWRKFVYKRIDRLTEGFVDRFIVVSDRLTEILIRDHRIPPDRVVKIFNGIETDYFSPDRAPDPGIREESRRTLGVESGDIVIGAFGRLVWQKGFRYLIEAAARDRSSFQGARLLIVGEGPLRVELEEAAARFGIADRVLFTGFREDIRDILSLVDLVVIPSLLEGFPLITLESMAMAKPLVATRIDGIIEQIEDSVSGILVPPGDAGALGAAVNRLIRDADLRKTLGEGARKRVISSFDVSGMVERTEELYLDLLSRKGIERNYIR